MRALLQRVDWAEVIVEGRTVGKVDGPGLLVYVGVAPADGDGVAARLAEKVAQARIFEDDDGKMNLSCRDVRGDVLAISNFTLLADTRKGRRPAFTGAAGPKQAERLYDAFCAALAGQGVGVERGIFRATMLIRSAAAGPVNVIIDVPVPGGPDGNR